MIKNITLFVLLIFCFTFIYPLEANDKKAMDVMGAVVITTIAVICLALSFTYYMGDNGKLAAVFGITGSVLIIIGGVRFGKAFEYKPYALLNIERGEFFLAMPDVSYSISEKEGTAPLFKYSF